MKTTLSDSTETLTAQEIVRILNEITESETFSKYQHKALLEYLVKATIEKKDLKEYTIAHDVFNKENDTGVRAYIHNLRKKLEEYYIKEGKNAELILTIPKGQYHVHIQKRQEQANLTSIQTSGSFKKIIALSIITIIVITLFILWNSNQKDLKNTAVWSDVLNTKTPLLIVLGDNYFYSSPIPTGKTYGVSRDFYINSENEFDEWMSKNKGTLKDSVNKINYSYITKQVAYAVFKLNPYLTGNDLKADVILSSELTYDQIKNNNILYIGKYTTLGNIKSLVDHKYFHEERKNRELSYIKKDAVLKYRILIEPDYKEDYPVILKFKTPYNKSVMMFVSSDDPGISASLDYFLDLKNIQQLEKKLQLTDKENSFSSLFKVKGLARTDFSIEYITGEKLIAE
jgi:hypothetical protein